MYDVIVMGGGPSGSMCSTLLAQHGRRVLLLEKDFFPRHHIGESLIPETYWPLKRSGALEKVRAAGFVKKFSVQFASTEGRFSRPFYFFETNHHESAVTWQVTRSKFDKILLDHARDCGVTVIEGATVTDVHFEGDSVKGVDFRRKGEGGALGAVETVHAPVTVDATGQSAILGTRLGIRTRDPRLKKAAVYGYFKDVVRDPGLDGGATLVLRTKEGNGWFWFIPLEDGVTSIGVVADPDYLVKGRGNDREAIYREEIARCPALAQRMEKAQRVGDIYTISDYSYRSTRCSGPGWVLIGDAFGFLDPVYSSGVFLALKSAELAADTIEAAFANGDFSGDSLGAYGAKLSGGIESFRKLVYAFYAEGFSFGKFMQKHPDCRHNLIDLLVGDVLKPDVDAIFESMKEFIEIPAPLMPSGNGKPAGMPATAASARS